MAKSTNHGNGRLQEAISILIQTQAAFLARISEMDRISSERFGRIEALLIEHSRILGEHSRILAEHTRILQALPDTIRERNGFRTPERPK